MILESAVSDPQDISIVHKHRGGVVDHAKGFGSVQIQASPVVRRLVADHFFDDLFQLILLSVVLKQEYVFCGNSEFEHTERVFEETEEAGVSGLGLFERTGLADF